MDLSNILSISGYPGLFKMIGQTKGGLVVESMLDGKRMAAYTTQRILSLDDITIYTEDGDVRLAEVFDKLAQKQNHAPTSDPKKSSTKELQERLAEVQPDFDRDRVYNSDLKKLFQWYNLLAEKGLTKENEDTGEEKAEDEEKTEKPKKAKKTKSNSANKKSKKTEGKENK